MMAKQPDDRFQTAQEVADALAPFIPNSSPGSQRLKDTTPWERSRLTATQFLVSGRRRWGRWLIAAAVLLAVIGGTVFAVRQLTDQSVSPDGNGRGLQSQAANTPEEDRQTETKDTPAGKVDAPDDPNVLTVAQTRKARYRSIQAALDAVKPGQTIRVLDDAIYQEALTLKDPQHTGISLEGPQQATLQYAPSNRAALALETVSGVRVEGFHFSDGKPGQDDEGHLIRVSGRCPGVRLLHLDCVASWIKGAAIFVDNATQGDGDRPLTIQGCTLRLKRQENGQNQMGIRVVGGLGQPDQPCKTRRLLIRDNDIQGGSGIQVYGAVSDIQISGNLFRLPYYGGLEFHDLNDQAARILVVNNSFYKGGASIRIIQAKADKQYPKGQFELTNNLLTGAFYGDLQCLMYYGGSFKRGNVESLLKAWRSAQNWRDLSGQGDKVPLGGDDHQLVNADLMSLNPADADFFRPRAGSSLAQEGAGKSDPSLPAYVGALPPPGVGRWDWQKTWTARMEK
jgi:hypothetical protein